MGKEQAKKLAESIGKDMQRVAAIYASPLLRTQETAVAIAKKTGADVTTDERLREVGFGPYEGRQVNFDDLTFVRERRAHKLSQGQIETIYHFDGIFI
jgi:broad specificity phosphatase PhoE